MRLLSLLRRPAGPAGTAATPGGQLAAVPVDMLPDFEAAAERIAQRSPGWVTVAAATYDDEAGSLTMLLADEACVTLGVTRESHGAQIPAMTHLVPTRVRLYKNGARVTALVAGGEWLLSITGLPALDPA